jgi:hypothetical protein
MSMGSSAEKNLLSQYTTPLPDIANRYEQNISKGGFLDMPGFKEMFDSYMKVGEREANRQAAGVREAFGSQGARYSSDLLASEGAVRGNFLDNLMMHGGEQQLALRGQQSKEVDALSSLHYGASEAGMTRLFQDFLRRTSPPPGYVDALNMSAGYGLPPTVV